MWSSIIPIEWRPEYVRLKLITVVVIQDSTLSESGSKFIILKWVAPMWEQGVVVLTKDLRICFVLFGACVFRFLLKRKKHDVH